MSEEKKDTANEADVESKEEDTKEEVEAPEEKEEEEKEDEEKEKEEDTKEEVDYEAIEKEEKERKPDADKAKDAFKERKEKRDDEEDEEEEKPLTKSELQKMFTENNARNQKTLTQDSAMQLARNMSSSEAEAKAIIATWNNRIFPEGMALGEQIEEMYIAVNRTKIVAQNSELKRALKGRDSVSKDSASTHKDAPEGSTPKLSSADAQAYKSAGLIWDGKRRLYKKELPNKKFMYKDPKTGKQWVA